MNLPDISRAYRLIRELATANYSSSELAGLDQDCETASSNLRLQCERLCGLLEDAEAALASGSDEAVVSALIHLRICIMGIGSKFDNLTDAIGQLFERGVVGGSFEDETTQ